jgi:ketosteroid isomerase-like protein
MNIKEKVEEMNRMIQSGQNMEAFEKYYHEDVVMQENNQLPTAGKDANREREKKAQEQMMASIEQFHGAELKAVAIGDNTTMVEWSFDMTYKGGHRSKMEQVAVQRWKDGQIIHERFYYPTN